VLTLPLTILTFGLFLFVVNALLFRLAAALVPGFTVRGFGPALLGSMLLSLLNLAVAVASGI
jgi:putative membrane protein